jgi:uncharacterized protein YjbI with pentapeptide repeats
VKIVNLSESHLTMGVMPANFPARLKPQSAGLSAVFFLKGVFRLKPDGDPEPWEEGPGFCSGDQMIDDNPEFGLGYASDFVPYKPVADFSAVGTAYPPKRADAHFPVRIKVGDREQEIKVFGPWKWESAGMGMTEKPGPSAPPVPVPINYSNAWGGPDYPLNPLGCGRAGEKTHLLEFPDAYITDRNFMSGPAVLAPMPPDSPLRKSKMGTYDKGWLEERWPWLPADFDYSFFNATHPKQWMEGYLRGDEPLRFENMHPKHPVYESRLPGLRARCFVNQTTNWKPGLKPDEAQRRFHEVPLALDTLWVDMEKEKLVLVWRGSTPVRSLKFRDIESLMILTESLENSSAQRSTKKSLGDYEALLQGALFGVSRDATPTPVAEDEMGSEGFQEVMESMKRAESRITKALDEYSQEIQKADDYVEQIIASRPEFEPQIREAIAKSKLSRPELSPAESAQALISNLRSNQQLDQAKVAAMTGEILEAQRQEEAAEMIKKEFKELQAMIDNAFPEEKTSADFMIPFPKGDAALVGDVGAGVPVATVNLEKLRAEGVSGMKLEKMDFSGLDLSGVDFSGAILSGCSFRGTKLHGANFLGTDLGDADLTDADFSGASMAHADLGGCRAMGSIWREAIITATRFAGLNLQGCDFAGVKGSHVNFTAADITGASFQKASIPHSSFVKVVAAGCDFTGAILEESDFEGANAAGIRMEGACLQGLRGNEGADFTGGYFRGAQAADSFWERATLTWADFRQATLTGAQFSEAILTDTNFDRCDLKEADFQDALMERAILTHANMLRCSFDRADMTGVRMDRSNLYESGFWETTLLEATWKDANVKLTPLDHA